MEEKIQKKKFDISLDVLRVIATICVILIHVTDLLIVNYTNITNSLWNISNVMEGLIRCSVPIFFMLTGALLLNKEKVEKPSEFYKKRFLRIVLTYAIWTIFIGLYNSYRFDYDFSLQSIFNNIKHYNVYYHFWFFEPLIITYALIPIIRYMIEVLKDKEIIGLVVLWIIVCILPVFVNNIFGLSIKSVNLKAGVYVGYLLIGYLLYNVYRKIKTSNFIVGFIMFVIGVSMTAILYYTNYNFTDNTYNAYLYSPTSLNILLSSTGMFIMIISAKLDFLSKIKLDKVIRVMSKVSFGVFIVHPILNTEFRFAGHDVVALNSITSYILVSVFIIMLSFMISYSLSKIPVVKKIV